MRGVNDLLPRSQLIVDKAKKVGLSFGVKSNSWFVE